eukprot:9349890-Pyramimonas_sp.AAC.1
MPPPEQRSPPYPSRSRISALPQSNHMFLGNWLKCKRQRATSHPRCRGRVAGGARASGRPGILPS